MLSPQCPVLSLIVSKNKHIMERRYKEVPAETAISLLKKRDFLDKKFQYIKRVIFGNKEYRVTQFSSGEINNKLKELVEEIYNSEVEITEKDLQNNLYNSTFVVEKLTPVLQAYLLSINEK